MPFLVDYVGIIALVFCRLGTAMMFMPIFGEFFVSPRIRLTFALALSFLVATNQHHAFSFPAADDFWLIVLRISAEIAYGAFLGLSARAIFATVHMAGVVIANQSGISNALIINPTVQEQGSVIGSFLGMILLTILIVGDGYQILLAALLQSYKLIPFTSLPPWSDMAHHLTTLISQSFYLALMMASPFILLSIIFNLSLGFLGRLVPQMAVYFVAIPLQIILALLITYIALPPMMHLITDAMQFMILPNTM